MCIHSFYKLDCMHVCIYTFLSLCVLTVLFMNLAQVVPENYFLNII